MVVDPGQGQDVDGKAKDQEHGEADCKIRQPCRNCRYPLVSRIYTLTAWLDICPLISNP